VQLQFQIPILFIKIILNLVRLHSIKEASMEMTAMRDVELCSDVETTDVSEVLFQLST
jgi:hypothetical protein